MRPLNKMSTDELLQQSIALFTPEEIITALRRRLGDAHHENFRLSAQCGKYYVAIRQHCKGINRLLRKRDHHRNKADRYAVALQNIIDSPMVLSVQIADAALNPPKKNNFERNFERMESQVLEDMV